jgi:uncharacterized protein (TIRG00374 family)
LIVPEKKWQETEIRYLINIVGSVLLFAILLNFLDFGKIGEGFARVQFDSIAIAVVVSAFVLIVASIRWWIFVRAARFPHRLGVAVRVRLIAQLLNLIIPSGVVGDGLQVFLVSRRPRLSGPKALATILVDRLVALFTVALLLLMTAWLLGDDMADLVYGVIVAVGIGGLVFFVVVWLSRKMNWLQFSSGRLKSILKFLAGTLREVGFYRGALSSLGLTFFLAVVGILASTAIAWFLMSDMANVGFIQLVPTFCLVMLSSFVPATFSGLGVREWIFFANLKAFGMSLEESVALSLTLFGVLALTAALLSIASAVIGGHKGESSAWLQAIFQQKRQND